jgi:hypothetical protein
MTVLLWLSLIEHELRHGSSLTAVRTLAQTVGDVNFDNVKESRDGGEGALWSSAPSRMAFRDFGRWADLWAVGVVFTGAD